jgi:hypothetical protein
MPSPTPDDVEQALRRFVERIDALAPDPSPPRGVEVRVGDAAPVALPPPVARALVEALAAYHDPRDRGRCGHCGGRRLDDDLSCADCGQLNGVFGQLVRDHRGPASTAVGAAGGG